MKAEAKLRKIGSSLGVIIPKEILDEIGAKENDTIILNKIERKPAEDIRGILKGTNFVLEREHADHY